MFVVPREHVIALVYFPRLPYRVARLEFLWLNFPIVLSDCFATLDIFKIFCFTSFSIIIIMVSRFLFLLSIIQLILWTIFSLLFLIVVYFLINLQVFIRNKVPELRKLNTVLHRFSLDNFPVRITVKEHMYILVEIKEHSDDWE